MIPNAVFPPLTVRAIKATPVEVPLNLVMGTSQGAFGKASLILVDLETDEGVVGRSYIFSHMGTVSRAIASLLQEIESLTKGQRLDPPALFARLIARFTLIGVQGVIRMAVAGFDVAAWDAAAIGANTPLCRLVGGVPKSAPAYNSCGLGLTPDKGALAAEAEKLLDRGFGAVKLRLGYRTPAEDIAAVHAVRERIGEKVRLMVDYNQALTVDDALARGRALDAENIYWLEEPIRHDDYVGASKLAHELTTPVQLGENFSLPIAMRTALDSKAADYVMPDLERIGGITGWLQAAEIAAAYRIQMSSHLYPEVSAHLLTATPTAHYLEYVDWMDPLLEQPLKIQDGHALLPDRPGHGMIWDNDAVRRFRLN